MRRLWRHCRCILSLVSSYALGNASVLRALGFVNRRLLGGRIRTVFMFYPASQRYADDVCYRWHQRRFRWQPGLVGMFVQNGAIGLCFAIPNTEADFKDGCNAGHVRLLMQRMDAIRERVGAGHRTFAGILPSVYARSGVEDRDVSVQRDLTARAVLAALDQVLARHGLPADVPVLLLGGRGYIASAVRELCAGRNVDAIDVGEKALFKSLIRQRRGHPMVVINLSKSGVLADYVEYAWPGLILLNEVYPEPSRHELRALESLGAVAYHIAGVKAWCWPQFPRAYRGGIPCCASLPLADGQPIDVVLAELSGARVDRRKP